MRVRLQHIYTFYIWPFCMSKSLILNTCLQVAIQEFIFHSSSSIPILLDLVQQHYAPFVSTNGHLEEQLSSYVELVLFQMGVTIKDSCRLFHRSHLCSSKLRLFLVQIYNKLDLQRDLMIGNVAFKIRNTYVSNVCATIV